MKKLKQIPVFKSEDAERAFWATHDLTDYFDMRKAEQVSFPNLKRTNFSSPTRTISLRLPQSLFSQVKHLADKGDVPYQSLIKIFLAERVRQELRNQARQ